MKPEVYIRVDGSLQIGLGHLVRCSALAHMLKDNFFITFFCKEILESFEMELVDSSFIIVRIKNEPQFFKQLDQNQIVVLDGYHFDTDYQKGIKATGAKLVCIDDLHDKEFVADLIINHAPGVKPIDYKAQPYTQFALGLEYVLLRPAFLEQAKKLHKIKKIETLLICFGGSDIKNLTQRTLEVALEFIGFKKIIVVTGSAYQITDDFILLVASDSRIDNRHNLDEQQLLNAMLEADLAIVPASGILIETLAIGFKVISGYYVKNQQNIYTGFLALNAFIPAFSFLKSNIYESLKRIDYFNPPHLIDGNSKERIVNKFNSLISNENTDFN